MYYDRPASELIFLPHSVHTVLHNNKRRFSDAAKDKIRRARLQWKLSAEAIAKSAASRKGRHWCNDGMREIFVRECPNGFKPGRLRETGRKISASKRAAE